MTGSLHVVGLGPGRQSWLVPEAADAIRNATDLVGYRTYLDLIPQDLLQGQALHGSDNRVEIERARLALSLAAAGRAVAVVSSGDPGVFAMASAVFEAQHAAAGAAAAAGGATAAAAEVAWSDVDVVVVPGVTAALATAARIGAPLGHDWCCLSLSDNLKPWSVIEARLAAAVGADFALALYNPVSRARPTQLARAWEIVRSHRSPETPIVLGRDVGRPGERVTALALGEVDLAVCDMRTVILVGSSTTTAFQAGGRTRVFTPRSYPAR